jgi:Na+/proline symporter
VFITWIFAKSIYNSAILGGMYGMYGGLAYASWYVSFFTAGVVCYLLRTRYGFKSMATAVYKNYGALGFFCYMFCLLFRLFNEIWSNATVIGSFYGASGSSGYWGACWLSTLIPMAYVLMGGMRASLFSDVFQALFAVIFLVVVLSAIASDKTFSNSTNAFSYKAAAGWTDDGWWVCFLGGILQGTASYPFFDPVLTDRGFLSTPNTMLLSFLVAGVISFGFIVFYAAIGVYGTFYHDYYNAACACDGGVAGSGCPTDWNPCSRISSANGDSAFAAWVLGHNTTPILEIIINFIMITASMSTLDSTFTSFAKLVSLEFGGWLKLKGDGRRFLGPLRPQDFENIGSQHLLLARGAIVVLMFLGICFLGTEKDAMKATSAAGTMVMGIGAPMWVMTMWRTKTANHRGWVQAPLAFAAPFIVGIIFGYLYYNDGKEGEGVTYDHFRVGSTSSGDYFYYSRFFGTNLIGHFVCFGVFIVCFLFHQLLPKLWFWELAEVEPEQDGSETIIGVDLSAKVVENKSIGVSNVEVSAEPGQGESNIGI